jgi:hypothetical protein
MQERGSRIAVFSNTLAFGMAYVSAIVAFHRFYLGQRVMSRELSLAMSIAFVQCATIAALLAFSFFLKVTGQLRASRTARLAPRIRELLALHAAGEDRRDQIQRLWDAHARDVEQCLVEFLHTVRGHGWEQLSQLAADLHLIQKWQRQYRSWSAARRKNAVGKLALLPRRLAGKLLRTALLDPDESVSLQTARAMIRNPEPEELTQIFGLAVNGSLVTRMILAEDLRPYALDLARQAVPAVLECGVPGPILAALQIVRAWGKFLALPQLYPLLRHPHAAIRAAAVDILSLVPRWATLETEIIDLLNDPVEEVRSPAARAAAVLGIAGALPSLARCLHDENTQTAAAAAYALAHLGAEGCRILEQETVTGSLLAASAALEALEQIHMAPAETAAL